MNLFVRADGRAYLVSLQYLLPVFIFFSLCLESWGNSIEMKPCLWWILAKKLLFNDVETLQKKKYHQEAQNIAWNHIGFKKTDFRFVETTFGFKIIWLFSKSALIIAFWRVKIARFENENEDVFQIEIRLRIENVA